MVLNVDGLSDFDALHSRRHDEEVQFYAFDLLAGDGDDYRRLPLSLRKTNLARLVPRRREGIFVAGYEQGEIGPDLFRAACKMGLEGMVSKHRERAYGAGPCTHWVKVFRTASCHGSISYRLQRSGRIQPFRFAEVLLDRALGLLGAQQALFSSYLDQDNEFVTDRTPYPYLRMNRQDMNELQLKQGDLVEVYNDNGSTQAMVYPTPTARPKQTFMLFAQATGVQGNVVSPGVNIIPNYKQTWANIRKLADAPEGVKHLSFKPLDYRV
ncbi:hypothetical protein XH94_23460 [Bradyrhizobium zhanjiangense]|uniref:ATP-dependent DNA ligase family profile domain-containing protein n=1 Tax=Bradyrhizobium zhanjiangense TaxID=1325107 RepID=A0A4Q0SFI4_9BRAD|nr:hypothetical protein XH94_23460 [Bradyrhizobium zhanjiangense]